MEIKTRILHTGNETDPVTGASCVPIYQCSTFGQADPVELGEYEYARGDNPTRHALERALASLEGGHAGFAFASGMAAISSVLLLLRPGDHLVVSEDVYGGTYRALTTIFARWGLRHTFVDMTDPAKVEAALLPETRALLAETPSNPTLRVTDLRAVAAIARARGLLAIVDNTFMTPYLQRPIEHGFDVVVHSATKFLGGHSDLIAGAAVTAGEPWSGRMKAIQISFGAILGPQDSFLLHRGLRTLAVRLEAAQRGAGLVAQRLAGRPGIRAIHYPGLASHPGREVHLGQASGSGAVVSFELPDADATRRFLRAARLPLLAVSLGGVESILSYPRTMSHAAMPAAERARRGISDGLVRLSVGLEDPADLIADLDRALDGALGAG